MTIAFVIIVIISVSEEVVLWVLAVTTSREAELLLRDAILGLLFWT